MIYIEMSRHLEHGGGAWGFPNCVWAPTKKQDGNTWVFWEKIKFVNEGDMVFHLRGKQPEASFVGYSYVSGKGIATNKRPPDPRKWGFARQFFRADLENYTQFHEPVKLSAIFKDKQNELFDYFVKNKAKGDKKSNIFFVVQNGQLQCLNGAYFSDLDEELFEILFRDELSTTSVVESETISSVDTGTQLSTIKSRIGQAAFSKMIKSLYGSCCCFPGCSIDDERFLVASHIARWSDNLKLRGELGNGLCFCLLHDKAFELGLFTLDDQYRVFVNPREDNRNWLLQQLLSSHGSSIRLADIKPLDDALLEHWTRVDIDPIKENGANKK